MILGQFRPPCHSSLDPIVPLYTLVSTLSLMEAAMTNVVEVFELQVKFQKDVTALRLPRTFTLAELKMTLYERVRSHLQLF